MFPGAQNIALAPVRFVDSRPVCVTMNQPSGAGLGNHAGNFRLIDIHDVVGLVGIGRDALFAHFSRKRTSGVE